MANDACTKLQLNIDMQDAFVPGIRRGYLVIPYKPKGHENERAMFSRLNQATQQVRQPIKPQEQWDPMANPKLCGSASPRQRSGDARPGLPAR